MKQSFFGSIDELKSNNCVSLLLIESQSAEDYRASVAYRFKGAIKSCTFACYIGWKKLHLTITLRYACGTIFWPLELKESLKAVVDWKEPKITHFGVKIDPIFEE